MNIPVRMLLSLLLLGSATLVHGGEAPDRPAGVDPSVPFAGTAEMPAASELLPYAAKAKKNPNLCPVCGRSWDRDVHEECFRRVEGRQERVLCPSCELPIHIRVKLRRLTAAQIDRDLCPHPPTAPRHTQALVICPRCGFSTVREAFQRAARDPAARLGPEERAWVRRVLTPRTQKSILDHMGLAPAMRPAPEEAFLVFDRNAADRDAEGENLPLHIVQNEVPDVLRCENAALFAHRFFADRPLIRARMTWLTAWAYRREVASPVTGTLLMTPVQRVAGQLNREFPIEVGPEKRVETLVSMYRDTAAYGLIDRQVILLMMAGDYQRLGYRQWALDCLKAVVQTARSDTAWQEARRSSAPAEVRAFRGLNEEQLAHLRRSLDAQAAVRLDAAQQDTAYLAKAADFLREALQRPGRRPEAVPQLVYLTGEFERRAGRFDPAVTWLAAATGLELPEKVRGAEIWAEEQLAHARQQAANHGVAVSAEPDSGTAALLQRLDRRVAAYTSARRDTAAMTPGAETSVAGEDTAPPSPKQP